MTELILRSSNGWLSIQWPCGATTDGPSVDWARTLGIPEPAPEGTVYVLVAQPLYQHLRMSA